EFVARPGSALRSLAAIGGAVATGAAVVVGAVLAVFAAATVAVIAVMASALLGVAGVGLRARAPPPAPLRNPATWAATTGSPTAGTSAAEAVPTEVVHYLTRLRSGITTGRRS